MENCTESILYTCQGTSFDICENKSERKESRYYNDLNLKIQPAYHELDKLLGLDFEKEPYLWCYTDCEPATSWSNNIYNYDVRKLWELHVPNDRIITIIDMVIWEMIIGNDDVLKDPKMEYIWKKEAKVDKKLDGKNIGRFLDDKKKSYSILSSEELWEKLCVKNEIKKGYRYHALIPSPIDRGWVVCDAHPPYTS